MKAKKLEKANILSTQIKELKEKLRDVEYTQNDSVVARRCKVDFIGGDYQLPRDLFKIVGQMAKAEYLVKLDKLEKELEAL